MTIDELIIVTGLNLDVRWNEILGIFQTWLRHGTGSVDIKENGLRGAWGGGKTRKASIEDYCGRIQGTTIVVNAHREDRQEIQIPPSVVYEESTP